MPFFPRSLTWYMAVSAACISSSAETADIGEGRDADRGGQADVQAVAGQEAVGGNPLPNALADRKRALSAGVGQHERELVAAEPRHDVRFARAAADDRGRLDQRPAAGQVSVRVVDRLEAVEIDKQQRQRPAAAGRALGFPPQDAIQIARVVEAASGRR